MPLIKTKIEIKAPIQIVFDLSRSIDLHLISTAQTNEKAISGRTSGLIELNESVTWQARHFGILQTLTSKITEFEEPNYFVDEMINGAFKKFKHEHHFTENKEGIMLTDLFEYESPFGIIGKLADFIFLKNYMTNFLTKRNLIIKDFAETDKWKEII